MTDAYASHLPFLAWIGTHVRPIKSVLELGAGRYSTPMWLDRGVFPDVERVVCIEQDEVWLPQIADSRLQVVHMSNVSFAENVDLDAYDLVFIDNGSGAEGEGERVHTIQAIMRHPMVPLVVVHDWENERYRQAVEGRYDWAVLDGATPQTALLLRRGTW